MFPLLYILLVFKALPASECVKWQVAPIDMGRAKTDCIWEEIGVNSTLVGDVTELPTWRTTIILTTTQDEANKFKNPFAVLRTSWGELICKIDLMKIGTNPDAWCRCSSKQGTVASLDVKVLYKSNHSGLGLALSIENNQVEENKYFVPDFILPEVKVINAILVQDGKSMPLATLRGLEVLQYRRSTIAFCLYGQHAGGHIHLTVSGQTVSKWTYKLCVQLTTDILEFIKVKKYPIKLGFITTDMKRNEGCPLWERNYTLNITEKPKKRYFQDTALQEKYDEMFEARVKGTSELRPGWNPYLSDAPPQGGRAQVTIATVLSVLTLNLKMLAFLGE